MSSEIKNKCKFKGQYLDYDDEDGEYDVIKCRLFTNQGIWDAYCDEEQECEECMLYRFVNEVFVKKYGVGDEFERFEKNINELKEESKGE